MEKIAIEGKDRDVVVGMKRPGDPAGEIFLDGREESRLIAADVEEECDGERVVAFESEGRGMKRLGCVQGDVDLLRVEKDRPVILAKKDGGGKLDQAGVEVEGVGSGAVGCRWRGVLRAKEQGCEQEKNGGEIAGPKISASD